MSKEIIISGLVGILIGVGIGSFSSRPNIGADRAGFMSANIDRHFIEEMIPHHEGAIVMAKVALERSQRPEILSLANGIIEAQERENADMRAWYQAWFGASVPEYSGGSMSGMMHGGMMGNMAGGEGDLEALSAASAQEFDLEFIRQMIPHHEMAIMMARMLMAGTERAEMKALADQIITSQSREINMMQSWYQSWSK